MNKTLDNYLTKTFICNKKIKNNWTAANIKVIGDIHGDYDVLIKSLQKARVINKFHKWSGGKTHLVQLGDVLDRGGRPGVTTVISDPMEEYIIYEFLNNLDIQAEKQGGKVHYLIGNHELMNMMGDFRYVHQQHLGDANKRRKLFSPGGYMANMLACHSYAVLKINDWYFCHAGLLPKHLGKKSLDEINNFVRGALRGEITGGGINNTDYTDILQADDSLFWNRFYVNNSNKCSILKETLDLLGNKNGKGGMVIGHTPHKDIFSECNQRLWFADVGLSDGFGKDYFNNIQVLHIRGNKPRVIK